MTPADFSARVAARNLTSEALPAARAVLVDGQSVNGAAREYGVDVGALHRLCVRIREANVCPTCGQHQA